MKYALTLYISGVIRIVHPTIRITSLPPTRKTCQCISMQMRPLLSFIPALAVYVAALVLFVWLDYERVIDGQVTLVLIVPILLVPILIVSVPSLLIVGLLTGTPGVSFAWALTWLRRYAGRVAAVTMLSCVAVTVVLVALNLFGVGYTPPSKLT